jgi:hypothetical protein
MTFSNRISQTLHDEHCATVALMERVEHLLGRYPRGNRPEAKDRAVAQLLTDISTAVEADIERHFAFEESWLFPHLDAHGNDAIGAHFTEEHRAMRPLGLRLAALARAASAATRRVGLNSAKPGRNSAGACLDTCRRRKWPCCRCSKIRWMRKPKPSFTANMLEMNEVRHGGSWYDIS